MAQEIYRRKKPGESEDSQNPSANQQHPLGKIPPPPQLPKGLSAQGETEAAQGEAPAASSQLPPAPPQLPTGIQQPPAPTAATPTAAPQQSSPQPSTACGPMPTSPAPGAPTCGRLSPEAWAQQLASLVEIATVSDNKFEYRFRCETPTERARAETLLTKEEGTIRWIDEEVQEGDVFYDIGANIGIFTLPAAKRVGPQGMVFAFEPHMANAKALLGNVTANQFGPWTKVISSPLSDTEGFEAFNYHSAESGSSMSQFGERADVMERPFEPCYSEWKMGTSIDALLAAGAIRPANVIKIDVDGNELKVLQGMQSLLTGADAPRSVQVEIHLRGRAEIVEFMQACGYTMIDRHYTAMGKQMLSAGQDPDTIAYLAIFRRSK